MSCDYCKGVFLLEHDSQGMYQCCYQWRMQVHFRFVEQDQRFARCVRDECGDDVQCDLVPSAPGEKRFAGILPEQDVALTAVDVGKGRVRE